MTRQVAAEPVLRLSRRALSQPNVRGVARVVSKAATGSKTSEKHSRTLQLPDPGQPFHFSYHVSRLCEDVSRRLPVFGHIDMRRVLVTFARCRNHNLWGLQAKLVPLRFRNGAQTQQRNGHQYKVQKFYVGDVELSYVLSFYLPRFLNQSFNEKLVTIFHELYHIDEGFTGDIRRFDGSRRSVHNGSQRNYDLLMAQFAREYLGRRPPEVLYDFLRLSFEELQARYGEIVGVHVPTPKLIPQRV